MVHAYIGQLFSRGLETPSTHVAHTESAVSRVALFMEPRLSRTSPAELLSLSVSALIHLHFNQYKLRRKRMNGAKDLAVGCTLEPLSPPWPACASWLNIWKKRAEKENASGLMRKARGASCHLHPFCMFLRAAPRVNWLLHLHYANWTWCYA